MSPVLRAGSRAPTEREVKVGFPEQAASNHPCPLRGFRHRGFPSSKAHSILGSGLPGGAVHWVTHISVASVHRHVPGPFLGASSVFPSSVYTLP